MLCRTESLALVSVYLVNPRCSHYSVIELPLHTHIHAYIYASLCCSNGKNSTQHIFYKNSMNAIVECSNFIPTRLSQNKIARLVLTPSAHNTQCLRLHTILLVYSSFPALRCLYCLTAAIERLLCISNILIARMNF